MLGHVEELYLSCTNISDISGLSGGKVKKMGLKFCQNLRDVSVLSTLTELKYLDLSNCKNITDVSMLGHVENLDLLATNVCDLSGLRGCKIKELNLSRSTISDVSILSTFTELKCLSLWGCENITDISMLGHIEKLEKLDVSYTKITNIMGLRGSKIKILSLSDCKNLGDISILSTLSELKYLNLANTNVSDLSMVRHVEELILDHTPISDISDLEGSKIKKLSLNMCQNLSDVSILLTLTELNELNLCGCEKITDESFLIVTVICALGKVKVIRK